MEVNNSYTTMHLRNKGLFLLTILIGTMWLSAAYGQRPFSIIAMGDMPYHLPQDMERFKRLTDQVNQFNPLFSVHVGDIKGGGSLCSDAYFYQMKDMFMQFKGPLILTPGDNDWTDCDRPACGE